MNDDIQKAAYQKPEQGRNGYKKGRGVLQYLKKIANNVGHTLVPLNFLHHRTVIQI